MKFIAALAALFAVASANAQPSLQNISAVENGCVSFTVGSGTGCAWMCNYCAGALGTNNYYFTDGVCSYQTGGCVGNPQAGKQYTCCAATASDEEGECPAEEDVDEPLPLEEETTVTITQWTRWA
jgi:hypothetical protein